MSATTETAPAPLSDESIIEIAPSQYGQTMEYHISELRKIGEELSRCVAINGQQTRGVIDLRRLEERARAIEQLRQLYSKVNELRGVVRTQGSAAEAAHAAEVSTATESLKRVVTLEAAGGGSNSKQKTLVAGKAMTAQEANRTMAAIVRGTRGAPDNVSRAALDAPRAGLLSPLDITPAASRDARWATTSVKLPGTELVLEARVLPDWAPQRAAEFVPILVPGQLYWLPNWGHFCMVVGGLFLHAGLGRVYADEHRARRAPERVKDCRHASCAGDACTFYHDPASHASSRDIRNYTAESWLYAPSALGPHRGARRRVGSADAIEADLAALSYEDARLYHSQLAHDLLVGILIEKFVLKPGAGMTRA